jgi:hypothetical protein
MISRAGLDSTQLIAGRAGHLFYPGYHFSYYTIVIPDESDCGGRDPVSSGFPLFPWIPDIHLRRIPE